MSARTGAYSRTTGETSVSVRVGLDGTGESAVATGNGNARPPAEPVEPGTAFSTWKSRPPATARSPAGTTPSRTAGSRWGGHSPTLSATARASGGWGTRSSPWTRRWPASPWILAGAGYAIVDLGISGSTIADLPGDLVRHFLESFAVEARITLHVDTLRGVNAHHKAEAAFKGLAKALRDAVEIDPRRRNRPPKHERRHRLTGDAAPLVMTARRERPRRGLRIGGLMTALRYDVFETDWGWVSACGSEKGARYATLPEPSPERALEDLERATRRPIPRTRAGSVRRLSGATRGLLRRRRPPDWDVALDLDGAAPFFRRVWDACRSIPYGETRTYEWLAASAGNVKAVRAAGQAMARNRVPIVIPCHRVIGKDGGLHGFGGPGLPMKERPAELGGRPRLTALRPSRRFPAAQSLLRTLFRVQSPLRSQAQPAR